MADIKKKFFSIDPITTDTAIVTVGDHLDFRNASDFKVILKDQVGRGTRKFILDFSKTKSFDSTGLGSLFALYRQLEPLSGVICFASTSDVVKYAVQMTHLDRVIRQFPTVEAARKALERKQVRNRGQEGRARTVKGRGRPTRPTPRRSGFKAVKITRNKVR